MPDIFNKETQKVITTTIDLADWDYAKKHNLKYAHMIRAFIRDHRVATNDPDAELSTRELKRRMEAFSELASKMRQFIEDNGLIDDFFELQKP